MLCPSEVRGRAGGHPRAAAARGARGLAHDQALLFFTGAGYARPAVDYANSVRMALFRYALDGSMTAVNPAAARLVEAAPAARDHGLSAEELEEVTTWARHAVPWKRATQAAKAGRVGQVLLLLVALAAAFCAVGSLGEAVGVTDPPPGAERVGWQPSLWCGLIALAFLAGWRAVTAWRRMRAAHLASLTDPGPVPAAAVTLVGALPGTRPGAPLSARMAALRRVRSAALGCEPDEARAVLEAVAERREVST